LITSGYPISVEFWPQKLLNFKPTITLQNGLTELAEWAKTHDWGTIDLFEKALKELKKKHLVA